MSQRNIAIANFSPKEVFNSSWPRFVGFKITDDPVKHSGLFGLIDAGTRMHAFFVGTTIEKILASRLRYSVTPPDINGSPSIISPNPDGSLEMHFDQTKKLDLSVRWLPPYEFTDAGGTVWDVYVLITGDHLHIKGTVGGTLKSDGYWDMGIWKPKVEEGKDWTDTDRLEQSTINHVHAHGYQAKTSITMFKDNPDYGKYRDVDVVQEVPTV